MKIPTYKLVKGYHHEQFNYHGDLVNFLNEVDRECKTRVRGEMEVIKIDTHFRDNLDDIINLIYLIKV